MREAAAGALTAVASHTEEAAAAAIAAGAARPLVHATAAPAASGCTSSARSSRPRSGGGLSLTLAAVVAVGTLGGHGADCAAAFADAGGVASLASLLGAATASESKLRRAAATALGQLASHSPAVASAVSAHTSLLVRLLSDGEPAIARAAAAALRELVKHGGETAERVAALGAAASLAGYANAAGPDVARLPAIMALGHLASASAEIALGVIQAGGLAAAKSALLQEGAAPHCAAAAVWCIAQCGRHGVVHTASVCALDLPRHVVEPLTLSAQTRRAAARVKAATARRRAEALGLPQQQQQQQLTAGGATTTTTPSPSTTSRAGGQQYPSLASSSSTPASSSRVVVGVEEDEADRVAFADFVDKCRRCAVAIVPWAESLPALQSALTADTPDDVACLLLRRIAELVMATPQAAGVGEEREDGKGVSAAERVRALENRKLLLATGGLKLIQV